MTLIAGCDSVTGWRDLIEARPSLTLCQGSQRPAWYDVGPVRRGNDWPRYVGQPQTDVEQVASRRSVERGLPYGGSSWQQRTITPLGLKGPSAPAGGHGSQTIRSG